MTGNAARAEALSVVPRVARADLMGLELRESTAFERDLRRVARQGRDLDKLEAIADLLEAQLWSSGRATIRHHGPERHSVVRLAVE